MKYFIFLILLTLSNFIYSQELDSIKATKYFSTDQIIYEINNNYWMNSPSGVKVRDISPSSNIYLMFPLLGKNHNISFAAGLGVGTSSVRYNSMLFDSASFTYIIPLHDSIKYVHNKIFTTYLEAPFELRFMTNPNKKNRSFKISLGAKAGYLVGKHIKYSGTDYFFNSGYNIKIKWYKLRNILPYRYGLTAKIGYGKFAISGFYSLSSLFEEGKGPEVQPYNIGISIQIF